MYREIHNEIRDLEEQIETVRNRSTRRGVAMPADDMKRIVDMQNRIEELRMSLPVSGPMTVQNSTRQTSGSGPFNSFGEQLQAIMRAGMPGGQTDQRLFAAASGLNETTPSDGGFLVQQDFSPALLQGAYDASRVAPRVNRIPISPASNGLKLPGIDESSRANGSRWGGVQSYWAGEADEATASKPKFRQIELNLKKLIGVCYATDELLADGPALEAVIRQAFEDEIAFQIDNAIINGTGAGQPLGILNSGALVTVSKEAGQGAKTILFENICGMFSRMPGRNRANAVWYVNQDVEPQLFTMSLAVGTAGAPVYLPGGAASASPYASLFGRPVIPIEQCPTLGIAGDILFVDPSQYLLIDKGGLQAQMSIHVRFVYDESVFRFTYRLDGQPSWASPMTPFQGSATVSPYVCLATRA